MGVGCWGWGLAQVFIISTISKGYFEEVVTGFQFVYVGHSGDFMQDSSNVLVELDMLFSAEDWRIIQEAYVYIGHTM